MHISQQQLSARSDMQYLVHPMAIVYPSRVDGVRKIVLQLHSCDKPLIINDPRMLLAITQFPFRFIKEEADLILVNAFGDAEKASIAWKVLEGEGVIIKENALPAQFKEWAKYNWAEASVYHEGTRDFPFFRMNAPNAFEQEEALMRSYVEEEPPPSIYQDLSTKNRILLQKFSPRQSADAFVSGMTESQKDGFAGMSLLFDVCFGERDKRPFGAQGNFLRKSIPSGGARHSTEMFFVAFSETFCSPGIYHYNVQRHSLDCIKEGSFFEAFEAATFDLFKKYSKPPSSLLIFTSLNERAMWRYREDRSWRATLVDLGHAVMAYRTASSALGYSNYTYQKFSDRDIASLLELNPIHQTPYYVGTIVK